MNKYKEDTRAMQEYSKIKVKCKYCGHSNTIPVFMDTKICNYCNNLIHNNTRAYFAYNLIKKLRSVDNSELVKYR